MGLAAGREGGLQVTYRYRLYQFGQMAAEVEAPTQEAAEAEIRHYAGIYGQDGPVAIVRVGADLAKVEREIERLQAGDFEAAVKKEWCE